MDSNKEYFFNLCKKIFNITDITDVEYTQILSFLEWFDSCGPNSIDNDSNGTSIPIFNEAVNELISKCELNSSVLSENHHALWYELNSLRNSARTESHAENSIKRINLICNIAEAYSNENDNKGLLNLPPFIFSNSILSIYIYIY